MLRSIRSSLLAVAVLAGSSTAGPAAPAQEPAQASPATQPVSVPRLTLNRARAALGSPLEIEYRWTLDRALPAGGSGHRAFVRFFDSHGVMIFDDDHTPSPPPERWRPGQSQTYSRTFFIPIFPYVGEVKILAGLAAAEDAPLVEVARMKLLPQTENIFLVYKEGWHSPQAHPTDPMQEFVWTKETATVSFKNPAADVIVYLLAETDPSAFRSAPVLTIEVAGRPITTVRIRDGKPFLKKVLVPSAALGKDEWVDLRLRMSGSFVPRDRPQDEGPVALKVRNLFVGRRDQLGPVPDVSGAHR